MSDFEAAFITQLREDFSEFKEDIRHEYDRTRGFLLAIIGVLLSAMLIIGFTHVTRDGETRTTLATYTEKTDYIMENAMSQKAISDILTTFDNQTKAMEKFLPNDIQGYIRETQEVNRNFRSYIMSFQSGLNMRGGTSSESGSGGSN